MTWPPRGRLEQPGQVLALFAAVVPLVLLPLTAYVVDGTTITYRGAALQAATAQAVEAAAQAIDVTAFRAGNQLVIASTHASGAAAAVLAVEAPGAMLEAITVTGTLVTVVASQQVDLPVAVFGGQVVLRARATARLVAGYGSPSSRLPLPINTF